MIHLSELRCACGGNAFSVRPGIEPMRDRVTRIALTRNVAPVVQCLACWAVAHPAHGNYRGTENQREKQRRQ